MNHLKWHPNRRLIGLLRVLAAVVAVATATPAGAQHHSPQGHRTSDTPEQSPAPPPPVGAPATEPTPTTEPSNPAAAKNVRVGVYFNHVHSLSLHDNSYHVDLYLWFVWSPTEWGEPPEGATASTHAESQGETTSLPFESFEFIGASEVSKEVIVRRPGYACLRVDAHITEFWDVRAFPFDDHVLRLRIEDSADEEDVVRLEPDMQNSSIAHDLTVPGWDVGHPRFLRSSASYTSNFGDPLLPSGNQTVYTRLTYEVPLHRSGWSSFWKLFAGLFAAVCVAMVSFFIRPTEVDPRFGLGVGGLFAAVASQYVLASVLPDTPSATLADRLHLIAFGVIFISIVEGAIALHLLKSDEEKNDHFVRRLDRAAFLVVGVGWIVCTLWMIHRARSGS